MKIKLKVHIWGCKSPDKNISDFNIGFFVMKDINIQLNVESVQQLTISE